MPIALQHSESKSIFDATFLDNQYGINCTAIEKETANTYFSSSLFSATCEASREIIENERKKGLGFSRMVISELKKCFSSVPQGRKDLGHRAKGVREPGKLADSKSFLAPDDNRPELKDGKSEKSDASTFPISPGNLDGGAEERITNCSKEHSSGSAREYKTTLLSAI